MKTNLFKHVIVVVLMCLSVMSCREKDEPEKATPQYYVTLGDITRECRIAAVAYPWGTSSWPRFVLSWDSSITSLTQMWDYVGILIPNGWEGEEIDLSQATTGGNYWVITYYDYYALNSFTVNSSKPAQVAYFLEGSTLKIDKLEDSEEGAERFRIEFHIKFNGDLFTYDYYHLFHGNTVNLDGYYEGEVMRDTSWKYGWRTWDQYFGQYL